MSSESIFEMIPGALLLLSNQATYLWIRLSNNSYLILKVKFSPASENTNFWTKPIKPIAMTYKKNIDIM
jgi:hypothetical protein